MDPDACLQRIKDADDPQEKADAQRDLREWLRKGGFEPTIPDWRRWL